VIRSALEFDAKSYRFNATWIHTPKHVQESDVIFRD